MSVPGGPELLLVVHNFRTTRISCLSHNHVGWQNNRWAGELVVDIWDAAGRQPRPENPGETLAATNAEILATCPDAKSAIPAFMPQASCDPTGTPIRHGFVGRVYTPMKEWSDAFQELQSACASRS